MSSDIIITEHKNGGRRKVATFKRKSRSYRNKPGEPVKNAKRSKQRLIMKNPSRIPNVVQDVYPMKKMVTLTTPVNVHVTPGTGAVYTGYFSLTSCNDPLGSIGSRQPMLWDQLTNEFYEEYKVWSGFFNLTFLPKASDTDGYYCVVCYLSASVTACTALDQALGQPGATYTFVKLNDATNGVSGKSGSLSRQFKVPNYISRFDDMDFTAYSSNPTNNVYANFVIAEVDTGVMANCPIDIVGKLTQRVQVKRAYDPAPVS